MRAVAHPLLALPRRWKRLLAIGVDVGLCALTVWFAYYLRLGEWVPMNGRPMLAIYLSVCLAIPIFAAFGLYRIVFRHAGADAVAHSAVACVVYAIGYSALISAYGFQNIPRTVGLIQPLLLFLAVAASRSLVGTTLGERYGRLRSQEINSFALIYGAGSAGQQLVRAMAGSSELKIVGFIDDDRSLHHSRIRGLPVYGPEAIETHIDALGISDVLLALPSASRARRSQIIAYMQAKGVRVRMLPGLMDLAHGTVQASDLREVTINDLLQRDPVEHESDALHERIEGHDILITGAGGSIGSELCRQIVAMKPSRLLLVEASEYALYAIHRELQEITSSEIVPLLASVADEARIGSILRTWKPRMVFHAAAYKHVPLVEHNPLEGLRNNVIGTMVMAELAAQHEVRDFVLVSTDKAVRPTNVMGASKRLAELVLQGMSASSAAGATCLSMVRFGNVLGSSGSVVPLFTQQIQRGGPITITHPDITRYFMTIPEAVHLVLKASAMAVGGEVFVLDMGEPVRIHDLARNMIQLSGLTVKDAERPHGDIEIQVVGLRPGEKLYEELLIGGKPMATDHPRILKAIEPCLPWPDLRVQLSRLRQMIDEGEVAQARGLLCSLVPEFAPTSEVVDWTVVASKPLVDKIPAVAIAANA
jgi:FlaA1/EpsC-like NDP-sugar epimerase